MAEMKSEALQKIRDKEFEEIVKVLKWLYHQKNLKYDDSFVKNHKTFREAFYNFIRKHDRLKVYAKGSTQFDSKYLTPELVDLAIYSIMTINRFVPKKYRTVSFLKKWLQI